MIDFYCTNKPDYTVACVEDVIIKSLASTYTSELNSKNSIGKL